MVLPTQKQFLRGTRCVCLSHSVRVVFVIDRSHEYTYTERYLDLCYTIVYECCLLQILANV